MAATRSRPSFPRKNPIERERKAAERRLKAARFPVLKTLETFDFLARPSVNKVMISQLARCEFIDRRENILFVGNPGTGKSHLAIALAAAACSKGYRVRFSRVTESEMPTEARFETVSATPSAPLGSTQFRTAADVLQHLSMGAWLRFRHFSSGLERSGVRGQSGPRP